LPILGAIVTRLSRAGEKRAVIESIDIEDTPHSSFLSQNHRNVYAASATDDLTGSLKPERIFLKMSRICGR
jgi:hypothetical protein